MKRSIRSTIAATAACLLLLTAGPAFSHCYSEFYCAFNEEAATVTKNGADAGGRVFTKTYDPEPEELFVLTGETMFLLKTRGAFMQRFGMSSVYDVTIHRMDETAEPVTIDYEVTGPTPGAVMEQPTAGEGVYVFTVGDDRYEVRLAGPIVRDPEMFVSLRGKLISKTERKGSKSEGPEYYLKADGKKIHVIKNAAMWEEDPALEKVVGSEIWITGTMMNGEIVYKDARPNRR